MGNWRTTTATDHVFPLVPPYRETRERETQPVGDVGGREREKGDELEGSGGGGSWYFDAKVIRHAWHYSQLGNGGMKGQRNRAFDPNVTKADLVKWKVSSVAPATPACTGSTLALLQRPSWKPRGVGSEMKVQQCLRNMCMTMTLSIACLCCTATGPPECANGKPVHAEMWEVEVREKCVQLPCAFFPESHFLRRMEKERWGWW